MANFRVRLETKDGCLIQNRHSDIGWFKIWGRWNDKMIRIHLSKDCREKGVELVSYRVDDTGIYGIVKWC